MEAKNSKALVIENGSQKKGQKRKNDGKNDNSSNKRQSKKSSKVLVGNAERVVASRSSA